MIKYYLEYYNIRIITSPQFPERARDILLPGITKDYVWVVTDWIIKPESVLIDCTSKVFPTTKIIDPDIDSLQFKCGEESFNVWMKGSQWFQVVEHPRSTILDSWIFV